MDLHRFPNNVSHGSPRDIGTLWTLIRRESAAVCSLFATGAGLELRVLVDGTILRSDRCDSHAHAFELAERWRTRLLERGWTRVVRTCHALARDRGASS